MNTYDGYDYLKFLITRRNHFLKTGCNGDLWRYLNSNIAQLLFDIGGLESSEAK